MQSNNNEDEIQTKKNLQYKQSLDILIFDPKPLLIYDNNIIVDVLNAIDVKWFIKLNLSNLLKSKTNNK